MSNSILGYSIFWRSHSLSFSTLFCALPPRWICQCCPEECLKKSVCCLNALNSWQGADMNHESLLLNRCHHNDPHPDHLGHPFHHPQIFTIDHYSILSGRCPFSGHRLPSYCSDRHGLLLCVAAGRSRHACHTTIRCRRLPRPNERRHQS